MPMTFTVDPRSGVPIYLQLIEQVKRAVALGALISGEQLPTVKQLALDLTINPNTVARAYRELEREAVIDTAPGRGSFIRTDGAGNQTGHAAADVVRDVVDKTVREAKSLGAQRALLTEIFQGALDRWFPEAQ